MCIVLPDPPQADTQERGGGGGTVPGGGLRRRTILRPPQPFKGDLTKVEGT